MSDREKMQDGSQFVGSRASAEEIAMAHAAQKELAGGMQGEIDRLRAALQAIVDESPPDTAYSWCEIKLKRCHVIARDALALNN